MTQRASMVKTVGGEGGTEFYYQAKETAINLQVWYLAPAIGNKEPDNIDKYGGIQMLDISFKDGTAFRVGGIDGRKANVLPIQDNSDIIPDKNWQYKSLFFEQGSRRITKIVIHAHLCPEHPHAGHGSAVQGSQRIFGIEIETTSDKKLCIGITSLEKNKQQNLKYEQRVYEGHSLGNGRIIGIRGRAGSAIDKLGFIFQKSFAVDAPDYFMPEFAKGLEWEYTTKQIRNIKRINDLNVLKDKILSKNKILLIVIAHESNTIELNAALHRLEPLDDENDVIATYGVGTLNNAAKFYIGLLERKVCILQKVPMGPIDVVLQVGDSINFWKPNAVIQTGIAWGADNEKQRFGDVLVSRKVIGYGNNTKSMDGKDQIRDETLSCGKKLLNAVKEVIQEWEHNYKGIHVNVNWFNNSDNISRNTVKIYNGYMIGAGFVLNDFEQTQKLIKAAKEKFPDANICGGEMESYALGSTAIWHDVNEWIVIKGISDWGDGNKNDVYQPFAAASAVKVVQAVVKEVNFINTSKQ